MEYSRGSQAVSCKPSASILWVCFKTADLFGEFKGGYQEIIFPAAFINPVSKIAVKRHIFNR
jgi:hypothetical protein